MTGHEDAVEDDHGMICRCTEEGTAEAEALLARVADVLSEGMPDPIPREDFLSALVSELNWKYDAFVDMIAADQWFGVRVSTYSDEGEGFSTYVECDRVEDGLAACFENIQKHAKEGKEDGTGSGSTAGQAGDSDPARPADAPG